MITVWNQLEYVSPVEVLISQVQDTRGDKVTSMVVVDLRPVQLEDEPYDYLLLLDIKAIDDTWHRRGIKLNSRNSFDRRLMDTFRANLKQVQILKLEGCLKIVDNDVDLLKEHQEQLAEGFVEGKTLVYEGGSK